VNNVSLKKKGRLIKPQNIEESYDIEEEDKEMDVNSFE